MTADLAALERLAVAYSDAVRDVAERRAELYAAIRKASRTGMPVRAIADIVGLSFGRVGQIVNEKGDQS